MDILNLFTDPLFVLLFFAASAVVMVPIIWIISCKQLTGTFSVRKFAFDRKYGQDSTISVLRIQAVSADILSARYL